MLSFLQKMINLLLQIRVLQIRVLQIRVLQIRVLQIRVLQIRVLQIRVYKSVFYKSSPCFTNPIQSIFYNMPKISGTADRKELKTVKRGRPKKENCANEVC